VARWFAVRASIPLNPTSSTTRRRSRAGARSADCRAGSRQHSNVFSPAWEVGRPGEGRPGRLRSFIPGHRRDKPRLGNGCAAGERQKGTKKKDQAHLAHRVKQRSRNRQHNVVATGCGMPELRTDLYVGTRSVAPVVQACVFCGGTPDSPEHVYPRWFLGLWDDTGPFTVKIDGQPLRARSGHAAISLKMWRVMLPCCGICNGGLDRLFEKPAKDSIRVLMRDMQPLDEQTAVLNAARWVVKTLALAAHPDANHTAFASHTEKGRNNPWEDYPRAILDAIKVGAIPTDTSLWFAVTDPGRPGLPDPPFGDCPPAAHQPARWHGRIRSDENDRIRTSGRSRGVVSARLSPASRLGASLRARRVGKPAMAGSTSTLDCSGPSNTRSQDATCAALRRRRVLSRTGFGGTL
jgi:hypothetical protein